MGFHSIEVLTLSIFLPHLHQRQLNLGGFLVQQGAEEESRKFLGMEPTWRDRSAQVSSHHANYASEAFLNLPTRRVCLVEISSRARNLPLEPVLTYKHPRG